MIGTDQVTAVYDPIDNAGVCATAISTGTMPRCPACEVSSGNSVRSANVPSYLWAREEATS